MLVKSSEIDETIFYPDYTGAQVYEWIKAYEDKLAEEEKAAVAGAAWEITMLNRELELEAKLAEYEKGFWGRATSIANQKLKVAVEAMDSVLKTRSCTGHKLGDCPSRDEARIYVPLNAALEKIQGPA